MNNKEFFQQCWKAEVAPTLTALKALPPADKLGYKPAEKNRTAKQLVDHFVSHVEDLVEAVETGVLNHRGQDVHQQLNCAPLIEELI